MKRSVICMGLVIAMVLGGCSWMGGGYVSVTPHREQTAEVQTGSLAASTYTQLRSILAELAETGVENAVIHVPEYDAAELEMDMKNGIRYISEILPVGAYAIDKVDYEIGTSAGQPALSVSITYLHGRSELRQLRDAEDMEDVKTIIRETLADCDDSVVINVHKYAEVDIVQFVADYAAENPNVVMEIPQVAIGFYPEQGIRRVLELKFTYQTSRDVLRSMQSQVRRIFTSASLYVNQNDAETQKYEQLFNFLMERFNYKIETSITPSYSLLSHGVGDGRAFANVYTAMCRSAGLDCRTVTGTRNGEAWYWNLICEEGRYYHVDLLSSSEAGELERRTDREMDGYVWDYSAYPATDTPAQPTEATE